ncbi:RESISTANCE TO PSEUDOMONAS SYRINGAE 3, RESISTANCE TO P. SYRINGAE PV MACULICOLA 1 [Hibiscus trionum]|uniref:RESISTANCE TO PSEUDOMONAS SYRINGAE 3, RESISTANCE TO P. SYRINGAE PV MACULICOLA 1 n=1 Tax=Hibiscus trionum TaxID=183268 RepID=A0A9W7J646_HIBTR|nr:RESISTANCE TO PSEUDOMONAS SYRINGAE 3, RESISTANCE TO P. SYRINGAE PV MACULICOLA 1 [Hibiscus trionum]
MAEIAVSFLLDKLTAFLQNEAALLQGIPEDLDYIKDELQSLKAILRVADSAGESNQEHKVWVQQVREIAYDTEDILDEYNLELVDDHRDRIVAFLHHVCCFTKNLKAQHRIASKLNAIKSRISNVSAKRPNFDNYGTNEQGPSSIANVNPWVDRRGDALLLDSVDLVGIDKSKEQLIDWLVVRNSGRKVVSVVGMGGSGKTTLAKQVYDNAKVKKHFAVHVWITISHPFKIEELLRNMVRQLFDASRKPVPRGIDDMDPSLLKMIIKGFLQQRRYLIVLDDVWHMNEWEMLDHALANNGRGSCVLLTTRNSEVATSCAESEDKVFKVEPLSPDESWTLFCKKCFRKDSCPSELERHSRLILEKCEGLPLAIVAISGVLARKRRKVAEWEMVYRGLGAEMEDNSRLINFKEVLLLSFNDLPYHLKSCFLYLSLFPGNHLIENMRLIRLWIAEGFVEAKEGKTQEEVAEDYLSELLNRSMIQIAGTANDGRIKTCRIHDLLREIIISNARDQNFVSVAKEPNVTLSDKVRRLAIHNALANGQQNMNTSHLRSLFVFGSGDPVPCSPTDTLIPSSCRLLKVLDLRAAPIQTFPEEISNLRLLRYLSLRDTNIKTIPNSIRKLQDLETLDLKHSQVSELPIEILKLKKLRHLLVYRYEFTSYSRFHSKYGFQALSGIGALQSLQKLCFMDVNHDNALIMELGKLVQLRRLGITNLRKEDGNLLCSSIEKLINLRALSIVSSVKEEFIDLQSLSSPPQVLQRLYLYGRLEKLPDWIPGLQSLAVIYLKWSWLPNDALKSLQNLPNLVHLELLQAVEGDTLRFEAGGFKGLKQLGIDKFEGLKYIEVEEGAMPCLEKLSIQRCKLLERVPLGIEYLTNLKVLEFFDMPEDLIKTLGPDANIPEVYYTYWRNGEWEVYSIESSGEKEMGSSINTDTLHSRFK